MGNERDFPSFCDFSFFVQFHLTLHSLLKRTKLIGCKNKWDIHNKALLGIPLGTYYLCF